MFNRQNLSKVILRGGNIQLPVREELFAHRQRIAGIHLRFHEFSLIAQPLRELRVAAMKVGLRLLLSAGVERMTFQRFGLVQLALFAEYDDQVIEGSGHLEMLGTVEFALQLECLAAQRRGPRQFPLIANHEREVLLPKLPHGAVLTKLA
jgi:hypothetical protein